MLPRCTSAATGPPARQRPAAELALSSRVRRDQTIVPCNIPPRCVKPVRSSSCSSGSSPSSIDFLPGPPASRLAERRRHVAHGRDEARASTSRAACASNTRRCPSRARRRPPGHGRHQGHRRAPREHHRRLRAGRHDPGRRPRRRRAARRDRPRSRPQARRPDRTARLRAARVDPGDEGQPGPRPRSSTHRCSAATRSRRRPSAPTRTAVRPSTSC